MQWGEKEIIRLKQLWEQGFSSGVIAERFGVSRSAIMGRVHRLGLKREKLTASQTMDAFAELLADGKSVADASRALGVTKTYGFDILARIRAGLGWQAQ
jgi:hypothetical protein